MLEKKRVFHDLRPCVFEKGHFHSDKKKPSFCKLYKNYHKVVLTATYSLYTRPVTLFGAFQLFL